MNKQNRFITKIVTQKSHSIQKTNIRGARIKLKPRKEKNTKSKYVMYITNAL